MRTPTLTSLAVCSPLALALAACGADGEAFTPPPPFEDKERVKVWATTASAVAIYSHVHHDIAVFMGRQSYADAACPVIEDDGTTFSATGGCTDSADKEWKGKLTIERDSDDFLLVYDGFEGHEGSFSVHQVDPTLHEFEAKLVLGGFTSVDYVGSVQGSYDQRTIWNGNGTVERDGFLPPNGTIEAHTLNEIVDDDVCAGQPASGMTTLRSGEDEAVITYDGESDCDENKSAKLIVNDQERGMIEGVNCRAARAGAPASRGLATLLGLCGAAWRLRRRRFIGNVVRS
jgi:hypothetical protein